MTNISVLRGNCLLAKIRKCMLCDSAKRIACKPRVARNLSSVYCIIGEKKFYLSHSSYGWHIPGKFRKSVALGKKTVICLFLAFNRYQAILSDARCDARFNAKLRRFTRY